VTQRAADSFLRRHFPTLGSWLGSLGWPILQRQLRADFRRRRFFLTHFALLAVLGLALIFLITANEADASVTPVEIGQLLFSSFMALQGIIVLVAFPAFSATSFSEERTGLTLDLLLTSTLRPVEIVWGKLLSSAVYCLMYLVGSVPLLSISFLFGGVLPSEVLFGYAFLIAGTLFISMLGVCLSSCSRGTIDSTLATYFAVLVLAGVGWMLFTGLESWEDQGAGTLVGACLDTVMGRGTDAFLWNVLLGTGAWAAAFGYLFFITVNRLRPDSDNRSTALRATRSTGAARAPAADDSLSGLVIFTALGLFAAAVIFSTEDVNMSRRVSARLRRYTGLRYPTRLLAPGAFSGFAYAAFLGLAASIELLLLAAVFAEGEERRVVDAALTLPFCVTALAALGFFLASAALRAPDGGVRLRHRGPSPRDLLPAWDARRRLEHLLPLAGNPLALPRPRGAEGRRGDVHSRGSPRHLHRQGSLRSPGPRLPRRGRVLEPPQGLAELQALGPRARALYSVAISNDQHGALRVVPPRHPGLHHAEGDSR
jgi:ABC-type transport system involved in multi-copper enzyme maturation permease subunit